MQLDGNWSKRHIQSAKNVFYNSTEWFIITFILNYDSAIWWDSPTAELQRLHWLDCKLVWDFYIDDIFWPYILALCFFTNWCSDQVQE